MIVAEIRSTNHRFLDITTRIPESIKQYEQTIKNPEKEIEQMNLQVNIGITYANTNPFLNRTSINNIS